MKKLVLESALAMVIGAAALTVSATSASAYIVCNEEGDCWHAHDRYSYDPAWGLVVHPDDWRWDRDRDRDYRWREHEGRGYWRGGVWLNF